MNRTMDITGYLVLVVLVLLYVLVWGQNWTHYAAAVMLAAIRNDWLRYRRQTQGL